MVREPDVGSTVDRQSEADDSDKHHDIFQKQAAARRWRSDTRPPPRRCPAILIVDQYRPNPGIVRAGTAPIWRKISHFSRCASEASPPGHHHISPRPRRKQHKTGRNTTEFTLPAPN